MTASQPFRARIVPLGDSAVMAELAEPLDLAANAEAHRIAEHVRRRAPVWVTDVVPALVTVTVHFTCTGGEARVRREAAAELLRDAMAVPSPAAVGTPFRTVEIPVCYASPHALDLAEVADRTGLAREEVVRLHLESPHRVLMIGFAPGHPYIGGLDPRVSVPRRAAPRPRMERGAVAIANAQTAIYPFVTPGGWNVIGRTPLTLFDPLRDPPSLLAAGDAVRFVAITPAEFDRLA